MRTGSTGATSLIVAIAASLVLPVQAQEVIQEVVVTARKKAESLQDTPLSVSAATQETLETAFLGNSSGIVQFSPNLVFDDIPAGTPGGGAIAIRGISLQDVEKTFDPAVLIHVDGVPLGTNSANVMNMLDVERVEVLRGPQGTLFGKNAVGGVINIYRTKPKLGEWGGRFRVGTEDEGGYNVEGVLNVPLGEQLAAKLSLARLETPGYYRNITRREDEGESTEDRYGVHLLWQPSDHFRAEAQWNESDVDGLMPPMLNINSPLALLCAGFGACAASDHTPLSGDRRKGAGDLRQDFTLETRDGQIDLNWDITDQLRGVLIYGHREVEEDAFYDFDGSPIEIFHVHRPNDYEQDSTEVRVDYEAGRFSATAGYFYWKSKLNNWRNEADISLFLGLPVGGCGFGTVACQIETASASSKSDSIFFEGDFKVADQFTLTAGARYIEETKTIAKTASLPVFNLVTLPLSSGRRKDDDTIYRLGARWEPTEKVMAYVSWSTGFRSGGFSVRAVTPEILASGYEPETVDSYELGIKTMLFDDRLRLNATYFYAEYEDMQIELQVPRPGPGSGTQDAVVNAGAAEFSGIEVEAVAVLSDQFSIDFNAGWLDAKYTEFVGQIFADGTQTDDNSHLPLRRAPEWNYTAALNYKNEIGAGTLNGRLSYNWRDDYAGTVTDFPGTHVDAFGVLDASLSYARDNWRLSIFGRNLTDEDEYSHTFSVVPQSNGADLFTFVTPRPPRVFGVELTYSFGN